MSKDGLSDEDKALFRAYVKDMSPWDKEKNTASPSKLNLENRYLSDYIREEVLAETLLSHHVASLPSRQFQDLKRGKIPWEARLDLHGLNIDKARQALVEFIQIQFHQNKRCLLIIHGKGGHKGEAPWIKNLVNCWLPQFDEVQAFHSALPKEGGTGALYVLLKKNRS